MATVSVAPITLKNATLTVASDNYTAAVTAVEFEPSPEWEWVPVFLSDSRPVLSRVQWECRLSWLQDLANGSLTRYLLANVGKNVTLTFKPATTGPTVTATVMLLPGMLGGGVDELLASEARLPLVGSPSVA